MEGEEEGRFVCVRFVRTCFVEGLAERVVFLEGGPSEKIEYLTWQLNQFGY